MILLITIRVSEMLKDDIKFTINDDIIIQDESDDDELYIYIR